MEVVMNKLNLNNDLIARLDELKQCLANVLPKVDMDETHGGAESRIGCSVWFLAPSPDHFVG
jgi:hypothetical protein